jgi:hypothetical protein
MNYRRLILGAVACSFIANSAKAEIPCSRRYAHSISYALAPNDVGKPTSDVLERWKILPNRWGLERISVVQDSILKQPALRFFYPERSINPQNAHAPQGGAGFYIHNGFEPGTRAACLAYRVYFPKTFEFGKGGKLPGLYGGMNEAGETAAGCRKGVEQDAFSTRYMWREGGTGSVYAYLPGKITSCGEYIGKGAWTFLPGEWTTLEQEVVLNDLGVSNGILRVWVNGEPVIDRSEVKFRQKDSIAIDGIFFVSFFAVRSLTGPDWASPQDQAADFSEIKVFFPR